LTLLEDRYSKLAKVYKVSVSVMLIHRLNCQHVLEAFCII